MQYNYRKQMFREGPSLSGYLAVMITSVRVNGVLLC
jgi:hypothetical protein